MLTDLLIGRGFVMPLDVLVRIPGSETLSVLRKSMAGEQLSKLSQVLKEGSVLVWL